MARQGLWPTPEALNQEGYQVSGGKKYLRLGTVAKLFPTPTGRDHKDGTAKSCENVPPNGLLGRVVHLLPTPQARDFMPAHKPEYIAEKRAQGHGMSNLNDAVGSLNPDWVEWLMGMPIGWTNLTSQESPQA
jgi:hypothetical protein